MNFNIITKENGRYLDCTPFKGVLSSEKDAIELVSACFSNGVAGFFQPENWSGWSGAEQISNLQYQNSPDYSGYGTS